MNINEQPVTWPRALAMYQAWLKRTTILAIAEKENVGAGEVRQIVKWVRDILRGSIKTEAPPAPRVYEKTERTLPKPKITRPPAVYSNTTPYGIAKEYQQ